MATDLITTENRLWAAADKLWANTGLKPSEFSTPVLGLIFLRYADSRFHEVQEQYQAWGTAVEDIEKYDYQAEGVLYLPEKARLSSLLMLAEADNLGRALNDAMSAIEAENEDLKGVLPRAYTRIENWVLVELLRLLAPVEIEGDAFGQVYEYFLGNFALKEGQKGGVFYTPTSIVKLIVEIIEPFHGRIFDPACGSGGMFVHSAGFVKNHRKRAVDELTVFGTEKDEATVKLAKMNLAVHGLSGDIRQSNTYYEDPHQSAGKFDFVMANPPFNLESSVGRAQVCGFRAAWQGATTRRGWPRKEEQRRQAARKPCNRVRSGATQWVSVPGGANASTHAASRGPRSGQLSFLGSIHPGETPLAGEGVEISRVNVKEPTPRA